MMTYRNLCPDFRTHNETYNFIKDLDSETAVTPYALRRLVLSDNSPSVRVGIKYIIDVDTLFDDLKITQQEHVLPGYNSTLKKALMLSNGLKGIRI